MNLLTQVFRRGWRTSEFWIAVLGMILATMAQPRTTAGTIAVGAIASSYILGRALVKGRAARQMLEAAERHASELDVDEPRGPTRV